MNEELDERIEKAVVGYRNALMTVAITALTDGCSEEEIKNRLNNAILTSLSGLLLSPDDRQFAWLQQGIANEWCSEPVCLMHDGYPMSDEEAEQLDDGWDSCIHGVRLYS